MRLRHFSPRTEEAYLQWMRPYHEFLGGCDAAGLGAEHVTAFLGSLATRERESASTQNQALAAVLAREEVRAVLAKMDGAPRLMAILLYGSGLRLLEWCRLRVKDMDFARNQITVRAGKGNRDRATVLPRAVKPALERGAGCAELPGGLGKKLPSASRHRFHETVLQHALRSAVLAAGIPKRATCHTLRHSFGQHLLEDESDIRTVQELLGHRDVTMTMIYTHVLNRGPADRLLGG